MAGAHTLTEDFATQNTSKWTGWRTGLSVVSGRLRAVADGSYQNFAVSVDSFDLTGSQFVVQVPTVPTAAAGTEAYVEVILNASNSAGFMYAGGDVVGTTKIAGTRAYVGWTPRTSAHLWVRLREAGGTFYVETSPDAATWSVLYSRSNPFALTAVKLSLGAANWNAVASPGVGEFDNVNPAAAAVTGALAGALPALTATFDGTATVGSSSSTVQYLFDTAAATNGDGSILGGTITATGMNSFATGVTTYAYAGSPVGQASTASTTAADAVANGRYLEFTLAKPAGTTSWTPTSLTGNFARGGSATPRGFQFRHFGDGYAADLPGGGDVTTQRTTWDPKTIDLTPVGTITGDLTLRWFMYAPTTGSTLEFDSWTIAYDYTGGEPPPPGDEPAIIQSGTSMLLQSAAGTTLACTLPAPATAGTLLFATLGVDKSSGTINPPAGGWNLLTPTYVDSNVSAATAWKVAAGGETGVTWTWTTAADAAATISEWNVEGAAVMGSSQTSTVSGTAVTSVAMTGATATGQGLALATVSIDTGYPLQWTVDDPAWSNGYALAVKEIGLGDASAGSNGGACSAVGYKVLSNGTTTGTTMSWTGADQAAGFLTAFSYTGIIEGGGGGTPVAIDSWHAGGVTTTGAVIATDTAPSASVRIRYSTDPGFGTSSTTTAVTADSTRGIAKHTLTGLTAGTTYYYRVQVDGVDSTNGAGHFKTTSATSSAHKLVFSSCRDTGSNSTVFDRIAARNPDLFIVHGDWHYQDINTTTAATYHGAYDEWQRQTNVQELLATVAHEYVWSDHDFCGNASHGGSTGKATAQAVFTNRMAHAALATGDGGIYRTFTVGPRARYIILDTRSYRSAPGNTDNSSKRMLGATQEQWLYDTLAAATEALVFIVSEVPWIGGGTQDDHWGSYQTEQGRIVSTVPSATWGKVVWLCGDAHMLAHDNGSNSPGGSPVWQAAALDRTGSTKGGPYSGGTNQGGGQYGEVTVTDDGTTVTATYRGITSADSTWGTHVVTRSAATPVTGALAGTLPALTGSLAGAVRATGGLAGTLPAAAAQIAGASMSTGALAAVLPTLDAALTGEARATGALAAALPALDGETSGAVGAQASLAVTLPALAVSLTGEHGPVTGTLGAALPAAQASLDGEATATGTLTGTLPAVEGQFTGHRETAGAELAATLPAIEGSLDGAARGTGGLAGTLPAVDASLNGASAVEAFLGGVLPAAEWSASSGTVTADGTLTGALQPLGGSLDGEAGVDGAVAGTLPALGGQVVGNVGDDTAAALDATLPALAGQFTATVPTAGNLAGQLPPLGCTITADATVVGTAAGTLPSLQGGLTGTSGDVAAGTVTATLPALACQFAGQLGVTGIATFTLPAAGGSLDGEATATGALAGALPPLSGAFSADIVQNVVGTLTATFPALAGALTAASDAPVVVIVTAWLAPQPATAAALAAQPPTVTALASQPSPVASIQEQT